MPQPTVRSAPRLRVTSPHPTGGARGAPSPTRHPASPGPASRARAPSPSSTRHPLRAASRASGQVTLTTWNAAGSDKKYSKQVDADRFFSDQADNDFIVLQEAGRVKSVAKRVGMQVSEGPYGTAICFRPRFKEISTLQAKILPGDGRHRDGTAIVQTFLDRETQMKYKVVCVHAGHNGSPHSVHWLTAMDAKNALEDFKNHGGPADVVLMGGDFNEMAAVVGESTVGRGCSNHRTHMMGANDKAGASGHCVRQAFSQQLPNYGSDHSAVKVYAQI